MVRKALGPVSSRSAPKLNEGGPGRLSAMNPFATANPVV